MRVEGVLRVWGWKLRVGFGELKMGGLGIGFGGQGIEGGHLGVGGVWPTGGVTLARER